jgi:hypothetical protein
LFEHIAGEPIVILEKAAEVTTVQRRQVDEK